MDKLKTLFQTKPIFLFLLPVFFVLHGFTDNYAIIPVNDALILTLQYIGVALVLSLVCWLLYRNFYKANLAAFFLLAYNFFFGSSYDFLKKNFNNTFLVKYSFILAASFILLAVIFIYIKKTKNTFITTAKYLNILLLLLLLLDTGNLLLKMTGKKNIVVADNPISFIHCDTCSTPDIYFIIADEYAGKNELKDIFSFDNTGFENELQKRGFHITNNTRSNYNWTIYSVASILNMGYTKKLNSTVINNRDMFLCTDLIKKNQVTNFLKTNGYQLHNYSFFDVDDIPKPVNPAFLPSRIGLLTAQTFTRRIYRALGYNFLSKDKINESLNHNLNNNLKVDSLTRSTVLQKESSPKFVYTHLLMPHYAYYFDSMGKKTIDQGLMDENKGNKKAYIEYLVYTNKKLLELVDYIKAHSEKPPLIVLMSDHGYRQFDGTEKVDNKYYFMNINAVLLPNGNYTAFYDSMSNVNQWRIILNTQFGQKLPLLKDSTSFLTE